MFSTFSGLSAGGWISELNQGSVRKEEEAQMDAGKVTLCPVPSQTSVCSQIQTWILTQALTP